MPFRPLLPLALLAALACGGCVSEVANRGHLADPDRLSQIQVGTSTRSDVLDIMGTPTTTGAFDDKSYYYIGEVTEKTAFWDPEVKERKVVVVRFDEADMVSAIDTKGMEDAQDVDMVDRETPVHGRDESALQRMLGNIGRFGNPRSPSPRGI